MTLSFKEVYARFWDCEERSGVAALRESGVPVWDIIRYDVCLEHLLVRAGLVSVPYRIPHKKSTLSRVAHLVRRIRMNRRVDLKLFQEGLLVLGNGRRKLGDDGLWHDALWDPMGALLSSSALYLQMPAEERIWDPVPTPHVFFLDSVFVRALFEPRPKPVLSAHSLAVLTEFEHMLEEATGAELDVVPIAEAFLSRHVKRARSFGRFLDQTRPKALFLTVGYGTEYMIEAAQQREIPVIEIQHGVIHKYHPAYHYPGSFGKTLRADYFFAFGEEWTRHLELPFAPEQVRVIGYPYFEQQRQALADVEKSQLIVIVSQAFVGEALTKLAVEARALFPEDVEVVLKLHPGEYAGWEASYPWLAGSGVSVLADDRVPLMNLQARAMVQVGCGSTALYEGLAFGCRTYCLDEPGIEVVQPLLEAGLAEILREGARGIDVSPVPVGDHSGFFASGWEERLRKTCQEIGLTHLVKPGGDPAR